jgi:hypothetical protein
MAPSLSPKPVDLRNPALFQKGSGEEAIARTIAEGIVNAEIPHSLHHIHHELAMPGFAHLTEKERKSVALYVISLRTPQPVRD